MVSCDFLVSHLVADLPWLMAVQKLPLQLVMSYTRDAGTTEEG